jgi:hypothetical protein
MSKFLTKKGHQGGLGGGRATGAHQNTMSSQVSLPSGLSNTAGMNHNNTKSRNASTPQGNPHAKVMGSTVKSGHGKYL